MLEHCPAHARRELRRDYNRIVYAKKGIDARKAYDELVAKWTPLAPAVVRSLEEAGNQLLTFAANMQVIVETHTNRVFGKIDKSDKSANPFPIDGEALSFEYAVYLRHHGFPSPLLDWTLSL